MTAADTALAGRVAVVTGASRGIGLATARALAGAGAQVALLARGADALHARALEIGPNAHAFPCDVADPAALDVTLPAVHGALGDTDILVSNAGLFQLAPVDETSPDDVEAALRVNLVAPFRLIRALLPGLRTRRGHVVTIGSVADHVALPGNAAYAASKFGVRGLHEVLRGELRGTGVRATLVSPGPVDTDLWNAVDPDTRPGFTPRREMLAPDAVAAAVLYAVTQPAAVNVDEIRLGRA